jgi:hypothetical protein
MEISNYELRIDKPTVKHLVKAVHERFVTDQPVGVRSVQPLHQTLT